MYRLMLRDKWAFDPVSLTPSDRWTVTDIDGLDPVEHTVYTQKLYGVDGEYVTGGYTPGRQIIITMAILPPVEENRLFLFRHFKAGVNVDFLYWPDFIGEIDGDNTPGSTMRAHGLKQVQGIVERIECNQYNNPELCQITIKCPSPYFKGHTYYRYTSVHSFPVLFNEGDVDTGLTFDLYITSDKDRYEDLIINLDGSGLKPMRIVDLDMYKGDVIYMSTVKGAMYATLYRYWAPFTPINIFGHIEGDLPYLKGSTSFESGRSRCICRVIPITVTADISIPSVFLGA